MLVTMVALLALCLLELAEVCAFLEGIKRDFISGDSFDRLTICARRCDQTGGSFDPTGPEAVISKGLFLLSLPWSGYNVVRVEIYILSGSTYM